MVSLNFVQKYRLKVNILMKNIFLHCAYTGIDAVKNTKNSKRNDIIRFLLDETHIGIGISMISAILIFKENHFSYSEFRIIVNVIDKQLKIISHTFCDHIVFRPTNVYKTNKKYDNNHDSSF